MTRECLDAEPTHQDLLSLSVQAVRASEQKQEAYPLETSQTLIVRSRLALTMKSSFGKNLAEDIE